MGIDLAAILAVVEAQLEKVILLRDGVSRQEDVTFPTIARTP